jgi:hypothetical protein
MIHQFLSSKWLYLCHQTWTYVCVLKIICNTQSDHFQEWSELLNLYILRETIIFWPDSAWLCLNRSQDRSLVTREVISIKRVAHIIFPALRSLKKKNCEFQGSLNSLEDPVSKNKMKQKQNQHKIRLTCYSTSNLLSLASFNSSLPELRQESDSSSGACSTSEGQTARDANKNIIIYNLLKIH